MQWWGVLAALLGAQGSAQAREACSHKCGQVYSLHTTEFEQINDVLSACNTGCQFFSEFQFRTQDSLTNLQGCNLSCDEKYSVPGVSACQAGCGFSFDGLSSPPEALITSPGQPQAQPQELHTTQPVFRVPEQRQPQGPRSEPPIHLLRGEPTPRIISSQPPRPTFGVPVSGPGPLPTQQAHPHPHPQPQGPRNFLPPMMSLSRPNSNPFLSLFNLSRMSPGPIMVRRLGPPPPPPSRQGMKSLPLPHMGDMLSAPARPPMGPMVMKEQVRGPTVIGFSLPNILNKVGSLLPQLSPSSPMAQQVPHQVEDVVSRVEQLVEESLPQVENKLLEIELEDPLEEILEMEETPRMSRGPSIENFFGRKDDDVEPFNGLVDGFMSNFMSKIIKSLPSQGASLRRLPMFPGGHSAGQMTIIKAGPGFREQQTFDIGPHGELTEKQHFEEDALSHENPMDTHFDFNDVEIFHEEDEDVAKNGSVEMMSKMMSQGLEAVEQKEDEEDALESEPVMDVRMVEEHQEEQPAQKEEAEEEEEVKKVASLKTEALPASLATSELERLIEVAEAQPQVQVQRDSLPFLSVLRNTVAENERLSQQLLRQFQELHRAQSLGWSDDNTCSSHHMRWSDWVACLHAQTGIPRWLTAATISLGIIFSVWLCLVIPSAAPKQKLKALVIKKAEKPSAAAVVAAVGAEGASAAAKAKEAEAAGLAVSVVTVDMPPTYTPGSPAPSYKSDMAPPVPGSPAPSYRSVDIPAEGASDKSINLEPAVHGEDKKESVA